MEKQEPLFAVRSQGPEEGSFIPAGQQTVSRACGDPTPAGGRSRPVTALFRAVRPGDGRGRTALQKACPEKMRKTGPPKFRPRAANCGRTKPRRPSGVTRMERLAAFRAILPLPILDMPPGTPLARPGGRRPEKKRPPAWRWARQGAACVRCGGEIEIRTLERLPPLHDFQSCSFDQLGHLSVFVEPVPSKRSPGERQAFFCPKPHFSAGAALSLQRRLS